MISAPKDQDPGDWGIEWDDLVARPNNVTDANDRDTLLRVSIWTCWALTGRRLGAYTETALPGLSGRCQPANRRVIGDAWYDTIDLDPFENRPVLDVTNVTIVDDGSPRALDPATEFGVLNNRWLVRTPQSTRWPSLRDVAAAIPALSVTWKFGLMPTEDLIQNGVGVHVGELWKAYRHEPCSLNPQTVRSVQREGISFALVSEGTTWNLGYTGNSAIDAACVRAWPLGPKITAAPGWFDPALDGDPSFAKFERATPPSS